MAHTKPSKSLMKNYASKAFVWTSNQPGKWMMVSTSRLQEVIHQRSEVPVWHPRCVTPLKKTGFLQQPAIKPSTNCTDWKEVRPCIPAIIRWSQVHISNISTYHNNYERIFPMLSQLITGSLVPDVFTWRKKCGELSATRHAHFTQVQHHQWC